MLTVLHDTVSCGLWIHVKEMCNTICSSEAWRQEERWSYFILPSVNTILLVSTLGSSPQPPLWRSGFFWALVIAGLGPRTIIPVSSLGWWWQQRLKKTPEQPVCPTQFPSRYEWYQVGHCLAFIWLFIYWISVTSLVLPFCQGKCRLLINIAVQFLAVVVLASLTPWWFGFLPVS